MYKNNERNETPLKKDGFHMKNGTIPPFTNTHKTNKNHIHDIETKDVNSMEVAKKINRKLTKLKSNDKTNK